MIITHRWTCESNMEETITCKGPCERKNWPKYGRSSFLRHLSQAKKCRAMYTIEEIDELKKSSHERKETLALKRKRDDYDPEVRNKKYKKGNAKKKELERQQESYDSAKRTKKYKTGNAKKKELERQQDSYDSSKRSKKHQRSYDSSKRSNKHQRSYDSSKRSNQHQRSYDSSKRSKKHLESYDQNKRKVKYTQKIIKNRESMEGRILNFRHECQYGPIFVCICCMRILFRRGVKKISALYKASLEGSGMIKHLQTEDLPSPKNKSKIQNLKNKQKRKEIRFKEALKVQEGHFLCNNCCLYLEKSEMPPICAKNSLEYSKIPDCLQLTNLERQLVCKDLVFIKVRELHPTRMEAMNDYVINVPIEDDDIVKTVTSLPRTEKNSGMITLGLKRDMVYKTYHKLEMIRPDKVYEALLYLIENHPSYHSIIVPSLEEWKNSFLENNGSSMDRQGQVEDLGNSGQASVEECPINDAENESKDNEECENIFNATTCLIPENPLSDVIGKLYSIFLTLFINSNNYYCILVNTSDKPITKKRKRNSDVVHIIAPGQRKKLSCFLVEDDHDINAFPDLFPDGKCGFDDADREKKITHGQNYSQKTLNHDPRFSQDADFIFVAQQRLERHSFESQISISVQRGVPIRGADGGDQLKNNNVIDVFKDIPGTPSFWKKFRNEIFARMEQLGPFHFFFTLSSAEMHWPEVTVSILNTMGKNITYEKGWEEDENMIKIDNVPLPEYKKKIRNKTEFFKKHFMLITRIFDNRVKAFLKLLTSSGMIEHYTYRIEFQLRGMPHLHGVFWLNKEEIELCKNSDGEYIDDKVTDLIDKWVSCSLDTQDKKLDSLVKEVNVHRHTKSCQKGRSVGCRFHFPKLPSRKTLIAHPISPDLTEEEQRKILSKSRKVLNKVKDRLEEMSNDDIEMIGNSLDNFLSELDISLEDYENALSVSENGKVVILKRTLKERNVNNYNKEFILAWRANIDIQFCYDGYAVVSYITDYFCKPDAGVTKAIRNAMKESKGCDNLERLNKVKRAYFTHRQVSAAEAVYRLIPGLSLKASNVKSKFLATGYAENRSQFFKRFGNKNDDIIDEENEEDDDDDIDEEDIEDNIGTPIGNYINIPGREGKFKQVETIHKKYAQRPNYLNEMSLAQFTTTYEYSKKPNQKVTFQEGISEDKGCITLFGTNKNLPKFIELKSGGFMKLRNSPCILRIHSSKKKKAEEGIYAELLLYFPWRSEEKLRVDFINKFNENYEMIKRTKEMIYPNSKMIEDMRELLDSNEDIRPKHLYENLDPAGNQENLDNEEMIEPMDTSALPEEDPIPVNSKSSGLLFKRIEVDEHDVMLQMARSLSFGQRIVFDQIIQFCKTILRSKNGATDDLFPPHLIVTGKNHFFIFYYNTY